VEANGVVVALTANYPQDRQRILSAEAEKLENLNQLLVWKSISYTHQAILSCEQIMLMMLHEPLPCELKVCFFPSCGSKWCCRCPNGKLSARPSKNFIC
jgi:hypothetical protein